jgi:ISSpo8 transposase
MELRKEMETMLSQFESLFDFQDAFQTEDDCIAHLEDLRWHEVVVSPFDSTSKVYKCKNMGKDCHILVKTSYRKKKGYQILMKNSS